MRITNGMKESIMRGVLRSKYKEDVVNYFSSQESIIKNYLDIALDGLDIKELKKHKHFVEFDTCVQVFVSAWSKHLSYDTEMKDLFMSDLVGRTTSLLNDKELPCHTGDNYFILERALSEKNFADLKHKREVLGTEFYSKIEKMKETKQNLLSVLNSCTTVKQLIEVLPEVEKFVPSNSTAVVLVSGEVVDSLKKTLSDI